MKAVAEHFLKALLYGVVIWLLFFLVFRPISQSFSSRTPDDQTADKNSQMQSQAYETQLKKSGDLLSVTEQQQKRMEAILTKHEEQGRRMDAVISAWEKQAKITK